MSCNVETKEERWQPKPIEQQSRAYQKDRCNWTWEKDNEGKWHRKYKNGKPKLWYWTRGLDSLWIKKYHFDIHREYDGIAKPVRVTYPNGDTTMFNSQTSCGSVLGLSQSALARHLKRNGKLIKAGPFRNYKFKRVR